MKSERHFWATVNYFPATTRLRHGYVERWDRLALLQRADLSSKKSAGKQATRTWLQFPLLDYGKGLGSARIVAWSLAYSLLVGVSGFSLARVDVACRAWFAVGMRQKKATIGFNRRSLKAELQLLQAAP